jgi:hypothetical protein
LSGASVLNAQAEIAKLKHAISGLIPWVATSGRGAAQEALAEACELIGADPFMWSTHPSVLVRRRPDLERRTPEAVTSEAAPTSGRAD